jgi:hypothetical protein
MLWIAKFDEAFIVKAFDLRAVEAGFNQFAGRYAGGALDGFQQGFLSMGVGRQWGDVLGALPVFILFLL